MGLHRIGEEGVELFCPREPRREDGAWRPVRFPPETEALLAERIGPQANLASPAGCALRCVTDAPWCELHLASLRHHQPLPSALDAELIEATGRRVVTGTELQGRRGEIVERFELAAPGAPAELRELWLWLPPISTCAVAGLGLPEGATLAPPPPAAVGWLAIGDSITQGFAARSYAETWVHRVMRACGRLCWNLGIAAVGVEPELFTPALPPGRFELATVGLGANDAWRVSAADGLEERVDAVLALLCPAVRRCVWLLPPWKPCEAGLGPERYAGVLLDRAAGERMGHLRERLAAHLARFPDFVEVVGDLLPSDPDLQPDGVHPGAAGFARMAERLAPQLCPSADPS